MIWDEHLFSDMHRVRALNPYTGEIENALLEEDRFGPRKDAIRFSGLNALPHPADNIAWEFAE